MWVYLSKYNDHPHAPPPLLSPRTPSPPPPLGTAALLALLDLSPLDSSSRDSADERRAQSIAALVHARHVLFDYALSELVRLRLDPLGTVRMPALEAADKAKELIARAEQRATHSHPHLHLHIHSTGPQKCNKLIVECAEQAAACLARVWNADWLRDQGDEILRRALIGFGGQEKWRVIAEEIQQIRRRDPEPMRIYALGVVAEAIAVRERVPVHVEDQAVTRAPGSRSFHSLGNIERMSCRARRRYKIE